MENLDCNFSHKNREIYTFVFILRMAFETTALYARFSLVDHFHGTGIEVGPVYYRSAIIWENRKYYYSFEIMNQSLRNSALS